MTPSSPSRSEDRMQLIDWGASSIGGPRHHFRETFMIDVLSSRYRPPGLVVEAGCGGGSLSLRLLSLGYRVVSFDPSMDFLRRLAAGTSALPSAVHAVLAGSADEVPLRSGSVGAVVCGEVLEHLDRDRKAVEEFARILEPGGFCLVTVPANSRLWDENDEWAGHRRRYDRGELESVFESAGLEVRLVRWWGFPILRPYHRWVYLPWARRAMRRPTAEAHQTATARLGKSAVVSRLMGGIFRLDRLFSRVPWGIGTLLLAQKPR